MYKPSVSELLCPNKCQGMLFVIYSDKKTVKCKICNKKSTLDELISEY